MPGTATREATALEQDYDLSQEQINKYQKNVSIFTFSSTGALDSRKS